MSRTGHFDKNCLYSTIKNSSGKAMTFAFLPPHGVKLANNQVLTVFGSILEAVGRGDRVTDKRQYQALADAIDRGDIEILTTPSPVLQDTVTGANKTLQLSSGSLSAVDPCWRTSDSLDYAVAA